MISAFIRDFVLPLVFFLFLRQLLGGLFSGRRPRSRVPEPAPPPATSGGKLFKDPVCGTYVSGDSAITLTLNGRTMYFCSRECWDKYRAS